jgi:hypothetical protein
MGNAGYLRLPWRSSEAPAGDERFYDQGISAESVRRYILESASKQADLNELIAAAPGVQHA